MPKLHQRGMTLLELILVLIVVGILASIAVPNFSGAFTALDQQKAQDHLVSDLIRARSAAQACHGAEIEVSFNGGGWTIENRGSASCALHFPESRGNVEVSGSTFFFTYPRGTVSDPSEDAAEEHTIAIDGRHSVTVRASGAIERVQNANR